uniref:Uncharacterized protein n=1 Tax=Arundo donax TaxID=35708 RepID=A0A0A8XXP7_ARUDO
MLAGVVVSEFGDGEEEQEEAALCPIYLDTMEPSCTAYCPVCLDAMEPSCAWRVSSWFWGAIIDEFLAATLFCE